MGIRHKGLAALLFGLVLAGLLVAGEVVGEEELVLKPEHPERYDIKRGDTLWDIASRFLRDPWRWPDIWYVNPQIANPHLIFPGDQVLLTYKDGVPRLELIRAPQNRNRARKLVPEVRRETLRRAIPAIPLDAINQFLARPGIVLDESLKRAPYVLSSVEQHLIVGVGERVYVRGLVPRSDGRYSIYRPGEKFRSPGKREVLGHQAIHVAEAAVEKYGDPSVLRIISSSRETLSGDRVLPMDVYQIGENFFPHEPDKSVNGHIISVVDGVSRIGQYQIVALDRGARDGLEPGHVLAVMQKGGKVADRIGGGSLGNLSLRKVRLPDELAGHVMVFRAFEKVSYALVMRATRSIRVEDMIQNP